MLMQVLADQSHHLAFLHDAETAGVEWAGLNFSCDLMKTMYDVMTALTRPGAFPIMTNVYAHHRQPLEPLDRYASYKATD